MWFPPNTLGLIEGPAGFIPKPVSIVAMRKKKGRHIESKNKKVTPPKTNKVLAKEVLSLLLSRKPPSPTEKSKEKD